LIDIELAMERVSGIATPLLVMGRETDHLQGIFRTSYELLAEAGKDVQWVSYDRTRRGVRGRRHPGRGHRLCHLLFGRTPRQSSDVRQLSEVSPMRRAPPPGVSPSRRRWGFPW
jgi:hypothetical protein